MTGLLEGKVAIVTGAAAGIGRATALHFVAEGAKVLAVDVVADALATLPAESSDLVACTADLTDAADVIRIFEMVLSAFGRLDILVNNAGIGGPRTLKLLELPLEDYDRVMAVNLRAPLAMTQAALAIMLPQGKGTIVNVASTSAYHVTPGVSSYSMSKAGVVMLTKATAKEYAAQGIRANAVAPGVVETNMLEGLPEPQLDLIRASVPQKRMGRPIDLAEAIGFLASDRADYMNGSVLTVDGASSC